LYKSKIFPAIELPEKLLVPPLPPEALLASAYVMTGRTEDAETVLHVGIYEHIISVLASYNLLQS
jgi:hypothetical protein